MDVRERRRHVDHLRSRRAGSDSMIPVCQREQVDTDTEITSQNAYKSFGSEEVASIPDVPMLSVTPEATVAERDDFVTQTRVIVVFTPALG